MWPKKKKEINKAIVCCSAHLNCPRFTLLNMRSHACLVFYILTAWNQWDWASVCWMCLFYKLRLIYMNTKFSALSHLYLGDWVVFDLLTYFQYCRWQKWGFLVTEIWVIEERCLLHFSFKAAYLQKVISNQNTKGSDCLFPKPFK